MLKSEGGEAAGQAEAELGGGRDLVVGGGEFK